MARRRSRGRSAPRTQDAFGKKARREGYPARSVYKLEEIDRRTQLLKRGQSVLDLGASPGSWTLYAAERVGPAGSVLGIDLKPPNTALPDHAICRVGDVYEETCESLGGPFDVVLSDMAPNTSGQRDADMYRSFELFMAALRLGVGTLRAGGSFVGKIFQGAEFEEARDACRAAFSKVRVIRPKATRDISYEVFLVGLGFKGVAPKDPATESPPATT
ncbi:MAG: RlmE family RNA methyltransferase [Myxococcota bacterium]